MVRLLAKTVFDPKAIQALKHEERVNPANPFDIFLDAADTHTFWTLGLPYSECLHAEISKTFRAAIYFDLDSLVVTTNTDGWHEIAQKLSLSSDHRFNKFVTVLTQAFPDIFKSLQRKLKPDGTTAIQRYKGW